MSDYQYKFADHLFIEVDEISLNIFLRVRAEDGPNTVSDHRWMQEFHITDVARMENTLQCAVTYVRAREESNSDAEEVATPQEERPAPQGRSKYSKAQADHP